MIKLGLGLGLKLGLSLELGLGVGQELVIKLWLELGPWDYSYG